MRTQTQSESNTDMPPKNKMKLLLTLTMPDHIIHAATRFKAKTSEYFMAVFWGDAKRQY